MNFKASKYIVVSDPVLSAENSNDLAAKRMIFSTRKGMGITVTNYLLDIIQSAQFEAIPDHMFNVLMYHEIVVPVEEDELNEVLTRKLAQAHDHKSNEIIIPVNVDTEWNSDFANRIADQIADRITLSKYKLSQIRLKLDIAAPDGCTLARLYKFATGFFRSFEAPVKIKVECILRCVVLDQFSIPSVDEDFIEITQFLFLIDLRNRFFSSVELKHMNDAIRSAEQADISTSFYLLVDDAYLPIVQSLRDTLLWLNTIRKVSVKMLLFNDAARPWSYQGQEQNLLKCLAQMNLKLDLVPLPNCRYYSDQDKFSAYAGMPAYEFARQWVNELEQTHVQTDATAYYDDDIVAEIRQQTTPCFSCIYLPMCGGRLNKNRAHNDDCPSVVSNLMEKAKLKYGIAL